MSIFVKPADAAWLFTEKPEMPVHIGSLATFTLPARAPRDFLGQLAENFRQTRIFSEPFNYRLKRNGLGRLLPMWERLDPEQIDLDYHFRHSALPQPGGERELGALIERLHSNPLDRRRPLWEVHLIEGLENRRFALYTKTHHSLFDGVAGARLLRRQLANDAKDKSCGPAWAVRTRGPRPGKPVPDPEKRAPRPTARERLSSTGDAMKALGKTIGRSKDREFARPFTAPRTSLNGRIQSKRRFATQNYDIDRIKALATKADVSINDVFMAMCSGALRRYLGERGQLPNESLVAGMPVAVRDANDKSAGNSLSFILAKLNTEIADPRERLLACKRASQAGKSPLTGLNNQAKVDYSMMLMAPYLSQVVANLGGHTRPMHNLILSNVPGPAEALYLNRAEMENIYPISLLFNGEALNISVVSYAGRFNLGFTGCRDNLPSMQKIAVYTGEALAELEYAFELETSQEG